MRIALDIRFVADHYPGIGRYAYELARLMPALAPDDVFVLLHGPAANTHYDLATVLSSPNVETVEVRASPRSLAQEVELRGIVRRSSIDLYHSPSHFMPYSLPCRTIATIHDLIPWARPESLPLATRTLYCAVLRLTAWRATRVLVDSDATVRDLGRWLPRLSARSERVYLGVDQSFAPVPQTRIDEFRHSARLPARYVLHVGTNKPHKNLPTLLKAWSTLERGLREGVALVLAGPRDRGDHGDSRLCQALDITASVIHYGPVAERDLRALYQGAEVFVFPSLYEGFGLPVLEAMAMGTPVACSDRSSLPEVAGDAALLFDPDRPEGIAHAIERLLADAQLRQDLATRGLARAREFTWERTARATLQAYRRALAPG
jgi:glycosyltransferase involved in cell wall biosynthesis